MSGTIYLGGGGSEVDEAALWDELFVPGQRVVAWPFALPDPAHQRAAATWLAGVLADRGDLRLETWFTDEDRSVEQLHGADVLMITGGNTFDLLAYLRRKGWLGAIREYVADGGRLYGGSAGAILCGADIATAAPMDSNDVGIDDLTGLDLLANCVVRPHHEQKDDAAALRWADRHDVTVLAIPENAGVIVDGRAARNTGPGTVTIFTPGETSSRVAGEAPADRRRISCRTGDTWDLGGPGLR